MQASEAHLILHVETLQARVGDLESVAITKEGYMQKEIARVGLGEGAMAEKAGEP